MHYVKMVVAKKCRMFDKWFDYVRRLDQWIHKHKPHLKPYTSVDDPRFQVSSMCTVLEHKNVIFSSFIYSGYRRIS